jgi:4-amino-4-deoxy-L-arabinose transferase-like glycosyltransferase
MQEFIHSLEEGAGKKIVTAAVSVAAVLGLIALFDTLLFRNMTTPEGMEMSQLARNIAEGKGYTTQVWRPLAIHLIQVHHHDVGSLVKEAMPDIQNPPLYPVLLAAWLKLMPFSYKIPTGQNFVYHRPDFWVALFNQLLLLGGALLCYRLASRLFESKVGWMSAGLYIGTWLYWQLGFSGHATLLLVVIFLLLTGALLRLDEAASAETPSAGRALLWAAVAGGLVGAGALTRYAFLWLIVPVALFVLFSTRLRHPMAIGVTLAAFLAVLGPWVGRNLHVCGVPFGTAGYALYHSTEAFPEDELERSLYPRTDNFNRILEVRRKIVNNLREISIAEMPRMGGNWMGIFFLVGILIPFRRSVLNRLRWFTVGAILTMLVIQAASQTQLTRENPDINSENLLAITAPVAFIFGAGLVATLVGQLRLTPPILEFSLLVTVVVACSFPMVLGFTPPLPYISSVVYPPYYPPFLQRYVGHLNDNGTASLWEKDLVMSDVPSALAWYARCPAITLSLNYRNDPADKVKDDFFELSDYRKTIKGLYLTPRTLKSVPVKAVVDMAKAEGGKEIRSRWENFVGYVMLRGKLPPEFPLQRWADATTGVWPEQLYAEQMPAR